MCFLIISVIYYIFALANLIKQGINDERVGFTNHYAGVNAKDGVTFHLYDIKNVSFPREIAPGNSFSLLISGYDCKKPTKFIIHGWTDDRNVEWVKEMAEAMASKQRWNVFVIDWAPLSHSTASDAYKHTVRVGDRLAQFTMFLVNATCTRFTGIHYIGHGFGALVASHSAQYIQTACRKTIARITGLDPTINLLNKASSSAGILSMNDAKFVDVIHTNGGELGTLEPLGHVDYYPNGGKVQPGCGSSMCSHTRACEYWIASIYNSLAFQAYNYRYWSDYMNGNTEKLTAYPMGIVANYMIPHGPYFLETTDKPPHVLSKYNFM